MPACLTLRPASQIRAVFLTLNFHKIDRNESIRTFVNSRINAKNRRKRGGRQVSGRHQGPKTAPGYHESPSCSENFPKINIFLLNQIVSSIPALIPMLTGTNVPESEEEIDAPIYDQREVEKIRGIAHNIAENAKNPEKLMPDFMAANPGIMSTMESLKLSDFGKTSTVVPSISTSPGPIFTLANGIPAVGTPGTQSSTTVKA